MRIVRTIKSCALTEGGRQMFLLPRWEWGTKPCHCWAPCARSAVLGGSRGGIQPRGAQGMEAVPKSHFFLSLISGSKPGDTQLCAWLGVSHQHHQCPPAPKGSRKGCGEGGEVPWVPRSTCQPGSTPALPAACGAGCHRLPAAGNSRGLGASRQSTSGRGCCRDPVCSGLCCWGDGGGWRKSPVS